MRKIDLTGRRFGRLVVLDEASRDAHTKSIWRCQCSCNKMVNVHATNLIRGNTQSCGCLRAEKAAERLSKISLDARKYTPQESVAMLGYNNKYDDGDISFVEFMQLVVANCFYCDQVPQERKAKLTDNHTEYYKQNAVFFRNGLDRIDNALPHNKDNCIVSCTSCNRARNDQPISDFYNQIHSLLGNINNIRHVRMIVPDESTIFGLMYKNGMMKGGSFTCSITPLRRQHHKAYMDAGLPFNKFYWLSQQNCFYCCRPPSNGIKDKSGRVITYSGLDRLDSDIGHTVNNVVPCCKYCNYAKREKTLNEFKDWIIRIGNWFTKEKLHYLEKRLQDMHNHIYI